jgi:AraC-like DNA-binding protein
MLGTFSPYVRLARDTIHSANWKINPRDIWDYEILYLMEGELLVTVNNQSYHGVPGDLFIFKPLETHSIKTIGEKQVRQPHLHFDLVEQPNSAEVSISFRRETDMSESEKTQFRADLLSGTAYDLPNHLRLENTEIIEKKIFEIISEYQMKMPLYEFNLKGMMINLLAHIIREYRWSQTPYLQRNMKDLLHMQQYLNHHIDREVTLEELSRKFNISKYYLLRLYKSTFQMSPIQYHRAVRLEQAKQLIQYTNLSMKEIADRLGYQNIHAFSRAFKAKEGVAPSELRCKEPGTKSEDTRSAMMDAKETGFLKDF